MALTQDRNTPMKDSELRSIPVAAGVNIHAGALIVANVAGFAAPGTTALNLIYEGRAEEAVDNTLGVDGAVKVKVRTGKRFQFKNLAADPVTQASQGKVAYIVDDETVAGTNGVGTRSATGIVANIDADGVWIK